MPLPGRFPGIDAAPVRALRRAAASRTEALRRLLPPTDSAAARIFQSGVLFGAALRHAMLRSGVLRPTAALLASCALLIPANSFGPGTMPEPGPQIVDPSLPSEREVDDGSPLHMQRVLDADALEGVETHSRSRQLDGVEVELHYTIPVGAETFAEKIEGVVEEAAQDFVLAVPDAQGFSVHGDLTVARADLAAVRLHTEESSGEGSRNRFVTLWYDATNGHVAESAELVADYGALTRLAQLAAAEGGVDNEAEGAVEAEYVFPTARMFASLGFNARGDLVVEFDEGVAAVPEAGRGHLVLAADSAGPLLSDLGRRAQQAVGQSPQGVELAEPAGQANALREPPGSIPPADDRVDCAAQDTRCVALTFDDGPGARTPELLEALAEYDARATFFVAGGPALHHRDILRRIYAEGHELGNHTMTHPRLTSLGEAGVRGETEPLQAIIRRETGYTPHLMRPPYGDTDDTVRSVLAEAGLAEVLWSVDTSDWKDRDAGLVAERAIDETRDGSIVLMHDIHDSTIDAVPRILKELDEKGFTFVTTTQLLGDTEPGRSYENAYGG